VSEGGASTSAEAIPAAGARSAATRRSRHWVAFFGIATAVVVADQITKSLVVAGFPPGEAVDVLGAWLRIWYVANSGALFGLFRDQAILFAVLSVAVMALIVWYHGRAVVSSGWLATIALGLLLGGAVGNFIDRIRLGYVVDFVDMGIPGGWRFYTWNVADAAITVSILLLLAMAILPHERGEAGPG
jgi:signal peptidase II